MSRNIPAGLLSVMVGNDIIILCELCSITPWNRGGRTYFAKNYVNGRTLCIFVGYVTNFHARQGPFLGGSQPMDKNCHTKRSVNCNAQIFADY
jgi:hypothetical protein